MAEDDCKEAKNVASSSKTWTSSMSRTLRRKISAMRRESDDSGSHHNKTPPEPVKTIFLRGGPSAFRNGLAVGDRQLDDMTVYRKREQFHMNALFGAHHLSSDVQIHISPESEFNYARLMQFNACYEAMPTSSKLVVFDTKLQLKKAFNGLIYQNTRHVLLSDSQCENRIVGILSVTDFIRVLLRLYKIKKEDRAKEAAKQKEAGDENLEKNDDIGNKSNQEDTAKRKTGGNVTVTSDFIPGEDIGTLTISEYRDLIKSEGVLKDLISITAEDSLLKAAQLLSEHRIHRLPVLDPYDGSPLFILTHKRILKFLWLFGQSLSVPDHHSKTCKDLGVGTFDGIRVVYPDTSLVLCLDILLNKGVSGVPVVEHGTFRVVDMYSRFDAIGVALEDKIDDLDVTVEEALAFRNTFRQEKDRVVAINVTDSLWTAMTVLVERNVHRLCVLKDNGAIEGLISLSDVINYMVVRLADKLPAESPHFTRLLQHSQYSSLSTLQEAKEQDADAPENRDNQPSEARSEERIVDGNDDQRGTAQIRKQFAAFSMD